MTREVPSAVTAPCPTCGQETLHAVLTGTSASRGGALTFDGTAQCTECEATHHVTVRQAREVELPVILSSGPKSRKARISLAEDEEVQVGDAFIVEGVSSRLTGIETTDQRRVEAATVGEVRTLWMKEFEEIVVGYAINLGHKTITKTIVAKPGDEFTVGEERVFGRLRVTVHAIKANERLIKRGTVEAQDIVRVFARPTPLGGHAHRPDKRAREQLREKESRKR